MFLLYHLLIIQYEISSHFTLMQIFYVLFLGPVLNPVVPLLRSCRPFASSHDFLSRAILNLFDTQFPKAFVPYALQPRMISSHHRNHQLFNNGQPKTNN